MSVDISNYKDTGSLKLANDEKDISVEDLFSEVLKIDEGETAVIETYFEQHEWYSHLNSSSVNTFRLWVVQKEDEVKTKLGYLRIGRVDSIRACGFDSKVDASPTLRTLSSQERTIAASSSTSR